MAALATDNFDRANSQNDLGTNWTTITNETAGWSVFSNQARIDPGSIGSDCGERYNAITWPNDQYSQFTIVTLTGTGAEAGPGPALRIASAARTYYRFVADATASPSTNCWIAKFDGGTYGLLASGSASGTWSTNDVMKAEVNGSTLTLYKNGVSVLTTTDAVITAGSAGVCYSSTLTAVTMDNWEGGSLDDGAVIHQTVYRGREIGR